MAGSLRAADPAALEAWLRGRRWFGAKAAALAGVAVGEVVELRGDLALALLDVGFAAGPPDRYQLLATPAGPGEPVVSGVHDALEDPAAAVVLTRLMEAAGTAGAHVAFHWTGALPALGPGATARPMGVEQSNTTLVLDDALALKAFRRLLPGENPELEMLRFLQAHGFAHLAPVAGWYDWTRDGQPTTLGVLQRFVAGGREGWAFALAEPDAFLARAGDLGRVTGEMHRVLAADPGDPDFAPEPLGRGALAVLAERIGAGIDATFARLPEGLEAVASLRGRGAELQDRLGRLSGLGDGGRAIRQHGDFHLGQTLVTDAGWVLLDFEGEPARPLAERRRKVSPLRDVAGMLRSFAYAAAAMERLTGRRAPAGWEAAAREAFLAGHRDAVDPALLPASGAAAAELLAAYELEKAVYELDYELNARPDWVGIPAAAIGRLLGD